MCAAVYRQTFAAIMVVVVIARNSTPLLAIGNPSELGTADHAMGGKSFSTSVNL